MFSLLQVPTLSEDTIDFVKNEWDIADVTHFGRHIEWKKETHALLAKDGDEMVGVLELTTSWSNVY